MVEDEQVGDSWDHGPTVGARVFLAFLRIATKKVAGSEAKKTIRTEWKCSSVRPEMNHIGAEGSRLKGRPVDDLRQVVAPSNAR